MAPLSQSEQDSCTLATRLAAEIGPGTLLLLRGNLGAGKTVFARALIRTLSGDNALEVPSPTFTLVQTYDSPKGPIWHFDLYRIRAAEEVLELGWEEALAGGIVLVEWPEKLEGFSLPPHLDITFDGVDNNPDHRTIEIARHDN